MPPRVPAFDRLRAALVVLAVAHHAMLAHAGFAVLDPVHYLRSTAPVVDPLRWPAVDWPIVFGDGFFMLLMFLLSGLFAWPSLRAHGAGAYVRRRLLRLGLPFAVGVCVLMPLAHYPALLARGEAAGLGDYWWRTLRHGPWPTGPLWFVWVLFAFDLAVSALHAALGRHRRGDRVSAAGARLADAFPARGSFPVLLAASLAVLLPGLLAWGSDHWFALGPFVAQASRIAPYAAYFALGVLLGAGGATRAGSAWQARLADRWIAWGAAALFAFAVLGETIVHFGAGGAGTGSAARFAYAGALALFAATAAHAALALFLRFGARPGAAWDGIAANGYGIYLLHYLPLLWLQYALLDSPLPAPARIATAFAGALAASWAATACLRRLPGAARVL